MEPHVQINHFNRGKPFYPLIMNYFIQLFGFKELAAHGVIRSVGGDINYDVTYEIEKTYKKLVNSAEKKNATTKKNEKFSKKVESEIKYCNERFEKLIGPLELKSEFQGNYIKIDKNEIAHDIFQNASYIASFLMRSAGNLLILAHEICKDAQYHDKSPIWEFLRHCRNAAAHSGTFTFLNNEPRHPAVWGSFKIENSLEGTSLFKDNKRNGLLSPGDPIRLLWDIEQLIPDPK